MTKNRIALYFAVLFNFVSSLCAFGVELGFVWTSAPRTANVGDIITVSAKYYRTEYDVKDAYFCCAGNSNGEYVSGMPSIKFISESDGTAKIQILSKGNGTLYVIAQASNAPSSDWIIVTIGGSGSGSNTATLTLSTPTSTSRPGKTITLNWSVTGGYESGAASFSISSTCSDVVSSTGIVSLSNEDVPRTVTITAKYSGLSKSVSITIVPICKTPVITPANGTIFTAQRQKVVITCDTADATIYYTTNGTTPSVNSTIYGGAFNVFDTTTVKAIARKSGFDNSAIGSATLTKYKEKLPVPEILVKEIGTNSSIEKHQEISFLSPDGAQIYYTTDGTSPSKNSTLYETPLWIFDTTTLQAIAVKDGWNDSTVVSTNIENTISLEDAVNCPDIKLSSTSWQIDSGNSHTGYFSINSGSCADGTTNSVTYKMHGLKSVSFRWKCSCEDDPDYDDWDYLCFSVDGKEIARIDGETDWEFVSIDLPTAKTYQLSWEYRKDFSASSGKDCGWIDGIVVSNLSTSSTPIPVPYSWLHRYEPEADSDSDYEAAAAATAANGRPVWECYVADLDPTDPDDDLVATIEMVDGEPVVSILSGESAERVYETQGAPTPTGPWGAVDENSRFFRVKVSLPE